MTIRQICVGFTVSVAFDKAWAVLKASPEHSVFIAGADDPIEYQTERYGEPRTVDDDWHRRLGTLHPALQWHRDKMFSPNRAIRHANLRVSPELDHDPENRIIQNIKDGAKTGKELFEGLTLEQIHGIMDVQHDRSRGGRILDVPTMRRPEIDRWNEFEAQPESMQWLRNKLGSARTDGKEPRDDIGRGKAYMGFGGAMDDASRYKDQRWQWDGSDNFFTRNFEPTVGPALTAQQMEELRRQGAQFLSEFS